MRSWIGKGETAGLWWLLAATVTVSVCPTAAVAADVIRPPSPGLCTTCPLNSCSLCNWSILPSCDEPDVHVTASGALSGTLALPNDLVSTASITGDGTEDTWLGRYGLYNQWTFRTAGRITYQYSAPFTIAFDFPGCVYRGATALLKNVQLAWGTPTLSGAQSFEFNTSQHFWVDIPGDLLDPLVVDFTQRPDGLDVGGEFPIAPLWNESWSGTIGAPFDDGSACIAGGCSTLGGSGTLTTSTVADVFSETMDAGGRNAIAFRTEWEGTDAAWSSTGDQVRIVGSILMGVPTGITQIIGGAVLVLNEAGLHLHTGLDLDVERRDIVWIDDVQLPSRTTRVPATQPLGVSTLHFALPVPYLVTSNSRIRHPIVFDVTFEAAGYDKNIIHEGSGAYLDASLDGDDSEFHLAQGTVSFDVSALVKESIWSSTSEPDTDSDGIGDTLDNCPFDSNADQLNSDSDGMGDVCDLDDDNDGIADDQDLCPRLAADAKPDLDAGATATSQLDLDGDGIGDACDADDDGDDIFDTADNCPAIANPGQDDADSDRAGDACDADDDDDGVADATDNCALTSNTGQTDADADGLGDACDGDPDGDGAIGVDDNCPRVANASQNDFDGDGAGDACDGDRDGDAVANAKDACDFTVLGTVVDAAGCAIAQLCPCDGPQGTTDLWGNHGRYVSCVAKTAERFLAEARITAAAKDAEVSTASRSACGAR